MARYDAAWGRPYREARYDRSYAPGSPWGGEPTWRGYGSRAEGWGGYAGDYTGAEPEWQEAATAPGPAIYGPGRYGLGPYHERLRKRRRSDAELKEEVEEALFYDTWVDAEAITVEVEEGVVTLSGALPSYEEIRYATDDAWDVDGVIGVRSELTVRER